MQVIFYSVILACAWIELVRLQPKILFAIGTAAQLKRDYVVEFV
jgi:hypothetical protein